MSDWHEGTRQFRADRPLEHFIFESGLQTGIETSARKFTVEPLWKGEGACSRLACLAVWAGNPELRSLTHVLDALGMNLSVKTKAS